MIDSDSPPDDRPDDQEDMDEIEVEDDYMIDEFGLASLTPMEEFEYHLSSGHPIKDEAASELVKRGVIPQSDLRKVEGGFEYVGHEWTI